MTPMSNISQNEHNLRKFTTNQEEMSGQENENSKKDDEEYINAQRAASEAITIGRDTVEISTAQTEQLQRCSDIMDRQKHILDTSSSLIKGMTWSGWFANLFSMRKQINLPKSMIRNGRQKIQERELSTSIDLNLNENYGDNCDLKNISSALKNYHCHVLLLQQCQTSEQLDVCMEICCSLHQAVNFFLTASSDIFSDIGKSTHLDKCELDKRKMLNDLKSELIETEDLQYTFYSETTSLVSFPFCSTGKNTEQQKQQRLEEKRHDNSIIVAGANRNVIDDSFFTPKEGTSNAHVVQTKLMKQNDHLTIISGNLNELQQIGNAIGTSLDEHNEILEIMEETSESLIQQTKMIVRRTDGLSYRLVSRFRLVFPGKSCNFGDTK